MELTVGQSLEFVIGEVAAVKGHLDGVPVAGDVGIGGETIDAGDMAEAVCPVRTCPSSALW